MEKWYTKKTPSHISMNGGPSLAVPQQQNYEFSKAYITQVKSNKLYLVELKTPIFRFFMDIDYLSKDKLTRDGIIELSKRVNDKIPGRCLVSVSRSKEKDGLIKSGIHLHWPNLKVTKKKALELRELVDEDIKPFVDESVYKGSGLRMLWSHKRGDEYPYVPLVDLSTGVFFDQNPDVDTLQLFSIRTKEISNDKEVVQKRDNLLEEFINKYVSNHEDTIIKKVSKKNKMWKLECNSRYCENKGAEHKSNHVYFVVDTTRWTIHQECFDECCKGYKGRLYKLSQSIVDASKGSAGVDAFCAFLPDH